MGFYNPVWSQGWSFTTLKFEIARMLDIKKKVLIGLVAGDSDTTITGFEKYAL